MLLLLTTLQDFFFHRIIPYCSYVVRYNQRKKKAYYHQLSMLPIRNIGVIMDAGFCSF